MPAEPAADLVVRRVVPGDWPALRALRLEALADTPLAFCERLVDAQAAPDSDWQGRAARGAVGGDSFQVMAYEGQRAVATSVGFLSGPAQATLAAVYVAPAQRGRRLLDRLVEAVVGWAREQGASELRLQVHESNPRAQRAYARLGFTATGRLDPYPLDPATSELELARRL